MASRTQLRLSQITGSYGASAAAGEGRIIDALAPIANNAAITSLTERSGSLADQFSHLASAVKRLHGFTSFAGNETGNFSTPISLTGSFVAFDNAGTLRTDTQALTLQGATNVDIDAASVVNIDAGGAEIVFKDDGTEVANFGIHGSNLAITSSVSDKDIIFIVNDGGTETEVARFDGDVSALLMASDKQIRFGGANTAIQGNNSRLSVTGSTFFQNDLTVEGDLTINGNMTTVDTQNLEVEDRLIGLNYTSGSAAGALNDAGLIIGNSGGNQKAFFWDNNLSEFAVVDTTSTTTSTTVSVGSYANFRAGEIEGNSLTGSTVTLSSLTAKSVVFVGSGGVLTENNANFKFDDAANDVLTIGAGKIGLTGSDGQAQVKKLKLDGDNTIELNGGQLTVNADDNLLLNFANNKKLAIMENNNERGSFQSLNPGAGETLVLSSSAGIGLALASNDDESRILLADNATNLGGGGVYLGLGEQDATFAVQSFAQVPITLLGVNEAYNHYFSGSLAISGTAVDPGNLRLLEKSVSGSNYIELNSPGALANNLTFTFPDAAGTQGQVISLASVSGNTMTLGYITPLTADSLQKRQMSILSSLSSGSILDPNGSSVVPTAANDYPFVRAALDLDAIDNADLIDAVDVYVNGQLLITGSNKHVGLGSADYFFHEKSNASKLKFGFDLEADDTIVVIKKA